MITRWQRFMKKTILITLIAVFVSPAFYGQTNNIAINLDSACSITQKQFENITVKYTRLLKTKKLSQISDNDHTEIIRLYNTTLKASEKSLENILFAYFINAFYTANYETEIIKLYPDYTDSFGKGHYFTKLKIELGGLLHKRSFYTIKNQ
jgi:hypothetical protein